MELATKQYHFDGGSKENSLPCLLADDQNEQPEYQKMKAVT